MDYQDEIKAHFAFLLLQMLLLLFSTSLLHFRPVTASSLNIFLDSESI